MTEVISLSLPVSREEANNQGFFFFPKLACAFGEKKYKNFWSGQDQFNYYSFDDKNRPANMRARLHNECVLEIDDMPVLAILGVMKHYGEILEQNNICYQLLYGGNKSYYIQIFFDISVTKEMIIAWLKTIFTEHQFNDFDPVNWHPTRLIGMEGMPHRHGFKIKSEIQIYPEKLEDWFVNEYPKDLFTKIKKEEAKRKELFKDYVPKKFTGKCGFLDVYMNHKFDKGKGGHTDVVPNFVIALPDKKLWQKASEKQGKDLYEFECWDKDIKNWNKTHEKNKQKVFSCKQVRGFSEKNGYKHVCDICPHKRLDLTSSQWDDLKLIRRARFS